MLQYLPKLNDWKNEVLFYLALAITIISEVIIVISDTNLDSLTAVLAAGPLLAGVIGRNLVYGPETAKALEAAAQR